MNSVNLAKKMRSNAVKMIGAAEASHVASVLSVTDIVAVLYADVLRFESKDLKQDKHDRFILSKGHAGVSVYTALAETGFIDKSLLDTYYTNGSLLSGHVSHKVNGVEISTGALGHGISIGTGMAFAQKLNGSEFRTYVVVGDGECNEGCVWEAAMFASQHKLSNLTVIVDKNGMQALGKTESIIDMSPLADKWKAFGFNVIETDGHNHDALKSALTKADGVKPTAVIADTVKGKGVSFMEKDPLLWHYRNPSGELLEKALKEISEQ